MSHEHRRPRGFTLIELLIVVAIIAILAAIAVPNFLEAQVRARVSRVKSDFRSLSTAMESYCVDFNNYPWPLARGSFVNYVYELSTPVAYMNSVDLHGPFIALDPAATFMFDKAHNTWYQYYNFEGSQTQPDAWNLKPEQKKKAWCVTSWGPSGNQTASCFLPLDVPQPNWDRLYDPTNGTVSLGEIAYFGGGIKISSFPR